MDDPDPLRLLRRFFKNGKPIYEKNNQIIFKEYSWPKTVKTNYLVRGSGKDGTPKEYYTLECLLFFLKNLQLSHPVYVREADAEKIPAVRRQDRKDLLKYLYGDTSYSASIDKSALIEEPTIVKQVSEEDILKGKVQIFKQKNIEGEIERAKEQLAATLTSLREASKTTKHIPSLSEVMSVKKIEEIKSMRLSKKRTTANTDAEVPAKYACLENDGL